jgi:sugar O-acyltransferase (sialic acid O-acetyltransferase NeuD family)
MIHQNLKDLFVVGAGGHGRETLMLLRAVQATQKVWRFAGFLDAGGGDREVLGRLNAAVVGRPNDLRTDDLYVVAIGNPRTRRVVADQIRGPAELITLVHPDVTRGSEVSFDVGCIVATGSRIGARSQVGQHTHLNVSSVVSADCRLGSFVSLSPGALLEPGVTVGHEVFVGTRAIIREGVKIGDGAIIGAGAVVVSDIGPGVTATGNPASKA